MTAQAAVRSRELKSAGPDQDQPGRSSGRFLNFVLFSMATQGACSSIQIHGDF
jgi:hypothetical protein